jgi:sugar phosphate isomerase/epimerase
MGVFVGHSISWNEPSLTTGEPAPHRQFLDEIRASVEVAQRLGATWMTVVPGARDPRLGEKIQTAHLPETLRKPHERFTPLTSNRCAEAAYIEVPCRRFPASADLVAQLGRATDF